MTDTAIMSFLGDLCTGAPARVAMSASPGGVDDALGKDGLAARLALGDHAPNDAVVHDGRHAQAVQQGRDSGFLHQRIGHPLEHLGVEGMTQGLRFGHGRAHGLGPLLELDANAFAINRLLVAIPGKALDPHLRDIAAEAAIAVDEGGARAGAGGRERRRQASRAAADHQDVGFQDHIHRTAGFNDLSSCGACPSSNGIRGRHS